MVVLATRNDVITVRILTTPIPHFQILLHSKKYSVVILLWLQLCVIQMCLLLGIGTAAAADLYQIVLNMLISVQYKPRNLQERAHFLLVVITLTVCRYVHVLPTPPFSVNECLILGIDCFTYLWFLPSQQPSTWSCTREIIRTDGLGKNGLFKGLTATLGRNGVWNGVYFGTYYNLKNR